MEDLWKLREMGFRLGEMADQAEYDRLIKRFREEEQKTNLKNLLFGESHFSQAKNLQKKPQK